MPSEAERRLTPRCYVCGEDIHETMILFSLSETSDRVFLSHENCKQRMSDSPFVLALSSPPTEAAPADIEEAVRVAVVATRCDYCDEEMGQSQLNSIVTAILPILRGGK